MTAAQRWADELAAWAIDPEILASVPESPYGHPPLLFRMSHRPQASPLIELARERLDGRSTVLDVGAGAGSSCLPLTPPARSIVAVDEQTDMLDALEAAARERDVHVTRVLGHWPDVAGQVPGCDVVVCSHVFYNAPDLGPFVQALDAAAARRVVVELTEVHPSVVIGPLWEQVHHQPRPTGPSADLAVEVLREQGIVVQRRDYTQPAHVLEGPELTAHVAFTRRRVCLPVEREPEVEAYLAEHPPQPRASVVLWWDR